MSKVTFHGKNRADVKNKALIYWTRNCRSLGLSLREFVKACSVESNDRCIVFTFPGAK